MTKFKTTYNTRNLKAISALSALRELQKELGNRKV